MAHPSSLLQSVLGAFKKQATLPKVGAQQLEKQAFLSDAFKVLAVCLVPTWPSETLVLSAGSSKHKHPSVLSQMGVFLPHLLL